MATLFTPMFYTSLATTVGFASLALAPIPPVQVFGLYIALGVMLAWVWTILFIPAYIMLLPDRFLKNFGRRGEERSSVRSAPGQLRRVLASLTLARRIEEDVHQLERTTDDYYLLKSTPRDPGSVEFAYFQSWIHRESFVPVRIEYFDKKGEKYREYSALAVETIGGCPTVTRSSMKNLPAGSETVMTYTDVAYNLGMPDSIFTERYLRNPPREFLR